MADTLTAAQIAKMKRDLGDYCDDYDSVALQEAYDDAYGNYCGALAILWREIYMKAKPTSVAVANGGQTLSQANVRVARDKMEFWQSCAGTGGATMTAGALNLGIDAAPDDEWS